jgi:hypothetical protein
MLPGIPLQAVEIQMKDTGNEEISSHYQHEQGEERKDK